MAFICGGVIVKKRIGILLIVLALVLVVIVIAYVLLNEISVNNKIVKKINDFYGDDIEIVSVERNFKLSSDGHIH